MRCYHGWLSTDTSRVLQQHLWADRRWLKWSDIKAELSETKLVPSEWKLIEHSDLVTDRDWSGHSVDAKYHPLGASDRSEFPILLQKIRGKKKEIKGARTDGVVACWPGFLFHCLHTRSRQKHRQIHYIMESLPFAYMLSSPNTTVTVSG